MHNPKIQQIHNIYIFGLIIIIIIIIIIIVNYFFEFWVGRD